MTVSGFYDLTRHEQDEAIETHLRSGDAVSERAARWNLWRASDRVRDHGAVTAHDLVLVLRLPSFRGLDLRGIDLSGMDFRKTTFGGARLGGASFSHSDVSNASFSGASLPGASFAGARAEYVKFNGANLRGADLCEAVLTYATFHGTSLRDADLSFSDLLGVSFKDTNLTGATLEGSHASYVQAWRRGEFTHITGARTGNRFSMTDANWDEVIATGAVRWDNR